MFLNPYRNIFTILLKYECVYCVEGYKHTHIVYGVIPWRIAALSKAIHHLKQNTTQQQKQPKQFPNIDKLSSELLGREIQESPKTIVAIATASVYYPDSNIGICCWKHHTLWIQNLEEMSCI